MMKLLLYQVMHETHESILMTCRQSPKYSVPGTRSCEIIIVPIAPPDWAIPSAVDLFLDGQKMIWLLLSYSKIKSNTWKFCFAFTCSKYWGTMIVLAMNPKLAPVPNTSPKIMLNQNGLVTIVQLKSPTAMVTPLRNDTALTPRELIKTLIRGANAWNANSSSENVKPIDEYVVSKD